MSGDLLHLPDLRDPLPPVPGHGGRGGGAGGGAGAAPGGDDLRGGHRSFRGLLEPGLRALQLLGQEEDGQAGGHTHSVEQVRTIAQKRQLM